MRSNAEMDDELKVRRDIMVRGLSLEALAPCPLRYCNERENRMQGKRTRERELRRTEKEELGMVFFLNISNNSSLNISDSGAEKGQSAFLSQLRAANG